MKLLQFEMQEEIPWILLRWNLKQNQRGMVHG